MIGCREYTARGPASPHNVDKVFLDYISVSFSHIRHMTEPPYVSSSWVRLIQPV